MKVGLIGEKLGHSFSKIIHEQIMDYTYDLIPLNIDEFHLFMNEKSFDAINVTIPYKEKVIPYLDEMDEKAKMIGAVNAIKNVNGKLFGTNTDYDGLKMMIENHFDLSNKTVVICGSGGTSKTAYAVCKDLNVKEIIQVARNRDLPYITYEQMKSRKDIEIIINTTSVGMSPDILSSIVDLDDYPNCKGVIDVVYNPILTSLCYEAKKRNIPYICGLEMLVGQAISAIEFFTNQSVDSSLIQKISKDIFFDKQNIVLIGMPSCGKSSLGKKLSKELGYDYIDIDKMIAEKTNKTIPQIFKESGEACFRKIESEVCLEVSKCNHTVISCGGGIIKNEINMKALALNGFIIYIKRDVDKLLVGNGRPLSKDKNALLNMFEEREPLYLKYSDASVSNNGYFKITLENLKEVVYENSRY